MSFLQRSEFENLLLGLLSAVFTFLYYKKCQRMHVSYSSAFLHTLSDMQKKHVVRSNQFLFQNWHILCQNTEHRGVEGTTHRSTLCSPGGRCVSRPCER